ncbi:MAG: hypothetical protein U5Q44_03115, partial [Dehalococcoidia bacterium]|nr:hypothetical protein [Dehalococcoidia bacterium]
RSLRWAAALFEEREDVIEDGRRRHRRAVHMVGADGVSRRGRVALERAAFRERARTAVAGDELTPGTRRRPRPRRGRRCDGEAQLDEGNDDTEDEESSFGPALMASSDEKKNSPGSPPATEPVQDLQSADDEAGEPEEMPRAGWWWLTAEEAEMLDEGNDDTEDEDPVVGTEPNSAT